MLYRLVYPHAPVSGPFVTIAVGIMVVLGIAPAPVHPLTDGQKVFQTLDGDTRIYAMPFAAPCEPGAPCLATADGSPCGVGGEGGRACRGSVMWQLSFPLPEEDARALSGRQAALKAEALRRCAGWHAPVPAVLAATAESVITGYPVYDRAVPTAAEFGGHPLSCVTMIGDA